MEQQEQQRSSRANIRRKEEHRKAIDRLSIGSLSALEQMAIDLCARNKRTVCELSCRLIHVDADSEADVAGITYPNVLLPASQQQGGSALQPDEAPVYIRGDEGGPKWLQAWTDRAWSVAGPLLAPAQILYHWMLGYPLLQGPTTPGAQARTALSGPPPLAWHPHTSCLAVATRAPPGPAACGGGAVLVYDMPAGERGPPSNGGRVVTRVSAPRCRLSHQLQPAVWALAWRPCRGSQLAVGTTGGVAVWSTSGSGRPPLASRTAGGRAAGPWLLMLRSRFKAARFSSLSWSPDGRLLAAASPDMPGITVWDVAAGTSTQLAAGLAAITLLSWSPCGAYLFAAGVGPRFHLFETSGWRLATWAAPPNQGPVVQAAWASASPPSSSSAEGGSGGGGGAVPGSPLPPRVLLLSFAQGGDCLVALHLVKEPPNLVAQLMPVVLQDIMLRTSDPTAGTGAPNHPPPQQQQQQQVAMSASRGVIKDWAWDPRSERLVVLLGAPHPAAGCLAVYATGVDPVVQARLLGYARPPPGMACGAGAGGGAWQGALAVHGAFPQGALVSARAVGARDGTEEEEAEVIYNLPMLYR